MGKVALAAKGLVKVFKSGHTQLTVLKGIDLCISAGEKIAIVGASGAGKTTLLHILGTLDRPTSGKVFYFDIDVFSLIEPALARFRNQKLGFIFQFHHLLPEFNTLENVMLPALIAGWTTSRAQEAAAQALKLVGLQHRLTHKMGELSGGERQRVAIARAIALKPPIILADEPTGNLDMRTAQDITRLLLDLNKNHGITLVVVTHNPELATQMDRIFGLVNGSLKELPKDRPWPWSTQ